MLISFYTSRIVLDALGSVDYGVYNVVGGIVALLGFVNASMTQASNRFFSYAIGKNDGQLLLRTYSTSIYLHLAISIVVVVLAETAGIWFFNNYINIPEASVPAAKWVYQLSVISAFIGINSVPQMALVISHEDMHVYAYVSLLEGGLKLCIAFLLLIPALANLKAYAIMTFVLSVIIRVVWQIYISRKYRNCRFNKKLDPEIFRNISGFVGWQMFSGLSWILRNQGANFVLNNFFGPILNTARSLALQINGGITSLVGNFQMASNPQMVKYYAAGQIDEMKRLLYQSSRISFLLLFVFAFPIYMQAREAVYFWLGRLPEYAVVFTRLIIIATLIDSLSGTLQQAAQATGKIRIYTIVVTSLMLSNIFLVYLAFKSGFPPTAMIYVDMILYLTAFIARLIISRRMYGLSIYGFLRNVTFREALVVILTGAVSLPYLKLSVAWNIPFFINLAILFGVSCLGCYFIGLSVNERKSVLISVKSKLHLG